MYTDAWYGKTKPNTTTAVHTFINQKNVHRESKKGASLTMAITLSIFGVFAKFFHGCKEQ